MNNKNINSNVRGFTLVELLAVIVILAVVMLIAVQAVLPRMESARKEVFALEANDLIEAAQTYVVNVTLSSGKSVVDSTSGACISVTELVKQGYSTMDDNKYKGSVYVIDSNGIFYYQVWLNNGSYEIVEQGRTGSAGSYRNVDVEEENVVSLDTSRNEDFFTKCGGTHTNYEKK